MPWLRSHAGGIGLSVSVAGLASGGVAFLAGAGTVADALWILTTVGALIPAAAAMAREVRHHRAGVDVVAVLALAGSLFVGEYVAGAVIALMLNTGRWLEARASARARRELSALVSRTPGVVHRFEGDTLTTPPLDSVRQGDLLLVAPGEMVPVDGLVAGTPALLDESALTGEATLVERVDGEPVRSGGVNAGAPFRLRASATAMESTYAGIVRLVRDAESVRAPLVRTADRFAIWFVPLTLTVAALAWIASGDPVRAVAVLVVATPCPLILAAPVAVVAGMSRAAHRGVVVKNGAALETLGRADVLLFDKTGTLTAGRARVADVEVAAGSRADDVLRLAASLDQVSAHALAVPIVREARQRGLGLDLPEAPVEEPGQGIRGVVGGRQVTVGRVGFATSGEIPGWARRLRRRTAYEGMANVFVGVDGSLAGALVLEDPIRPDSARTLDRLRRAGIRRLVMVTGDHPDVAESVASMLGVDAVDAERSPADKAEVVRLEREHGTVVMVGDGINDAPALAVADVGVAMGARGSTASSQAADVVLLVDRLDRLGDALTIARRSHRIALQSIVAGMGLSSVAMAAAAAGRLAPVAGALVQEAIDVAVILNALRAHRGGPLERRPSAGAVTAGQHVLEEHASLRRGTAHIRDVADELGAVPADVAMTELTEVRRFLDEELLPHEHDEEVGFYSVAAPYIGGPEVVTTVRRAHAEIAHLTRVFGRMLDDLDASGPTDEELPGLRRVLYGLSAVLALHRAEEEADHVLRVVDDEPAAQTSAASSGVRAGSASAMIAARSATRHE